MNEITIKKFTVQDVIDAIEENGLEHLRKEWFQTTSDGKLTGACVLGQGAINLSVIAEDNEQFKEEYDPDRNMFIENWANPSRTEPDLVTQLNRFRVTVSKWRRDINTRCGTAIIDWNDEIDYTKDNSVRIHYFLPTYTDVVNMVKEVLFPHRKKFVYLAVKDYTFNA